SVHPWPGRTSVTCAAPRAAPGAGSRAASPRPAPPRAARRSAAPATPTSAACPSPTTSRTTSRSSTTSPPPTPTTSPRPAWPRSGHNGQANHQYDLSWFFKALNGRNLPSVSFLKAAAYQDGHAGYSDPTDEQHFLVN